MRPAAHSPDTVAFPQLVSGPVPWEDPLEKEMTTHSSVPAWRIPQTEGPDGLQSLGLQEWDMT